LDRDALEDPIERLGLAGRRVKLDRRRVAIDESMLDRALSCRDAVDAHTTWPSHASDDRLVGRCDVMLPSKLRPKRRLDPRRLGVARDRDEAVEEHRVRRVVLRVARLDTMHTHGLVARRKEKLHEPLGRARREDDDLADAISDVDDGFGGRRAFTRGSRDAQPDADAARHRGVGEEKRVLAWIERALIRLDVTDERVKGATARSLRDPPRRLDEPHAGASLDREHASPAKSAREAGSKRRDAIDVEG